MAFPDAYSRQNISRADINEVCESLSSDFLTQGPAVARFEDKISEACEVPHCLAVSSATAGLHLALMALDINQESLVWTTGNTFVSTANVGRLLGATVDFVDIDNATWMISPQILEKKLLDTIHQGNRTPDVVILVHFAGASYDLKGFSKLASKYNFKIVEDAAHAFGAFCGGNPVGITTDSDIAVFSFHAIKPLTTGEGGAITTRNQDLFKKMQALRTHGVVKTESEFKNHPDGAWYYEQHGLGLNYRITDFQCALGLSQLKRYPLFLERRRELVELYEQNLPKEFCISQLLPDSCKSSHHIYPILVNENYRKQLFDRLRAKQIGVNVHYIPVFRQPYYKNISEYGHCPNTEHYYSRTISLPLHTHLSDNEVIEVCSEITNFLEATTYE